LFASAAPLDLGLRAAMIRAVCLAVFSGLASATVELTEKDFKGAIEGKNALVKFLAPW